MCDCNARGSWTGEVMEMPCIGNGHDCLPHRPSWRLFERVSARTGVLEDDY